MEELVHSKNYQLLHNFFYKDIAAKENKLNEKKILVDDTIKEGKLSKYEIIKKMIDGLVHEIEDLKKILFNDLAVTNN